MTSASGKIHRGHSCSVDPSVANDNTAVAYSIRYEFFEQCILPITLPTQYTLPSLLSLASKLSHSTTLAYSDWLALSKSHLQLPLEVASALFEICITITCRSHKTQLELSRLEASAYGDSDEAVWDRFSMSRCVDVVEFMVLLVAQLFSRAMPRQSVDIVMLPVDALPPTHASQPQAGALLHTKQPVAAPLNHVSLCEQAQAFVSQHLVALLDVIAVCCGQQAGESAILPRPKVQSLSMIICEGTNATESAEFGSLIPWTGAAGTPSLDRKALAAFLAKHTGRPAGLLPPPAEASSPRHAGRGSPFIVWPTCSTVDSSRRAAPAVASAPKTNHFVIANLYRSMFARGSPPEGSVPPRHLKIAACSSVTLYLLVPLEHVAITACVGCTIVLGPVAKTLVIEGCDACRIVCAARVLRVVCCHDTRVYALTNTAPTLMAPVNTSCGALLAPYNTFYGSLEEHLLQTGINPKFNLWNAVSPHYLLAAALFTSITVPIASAGLTSTNPTSLPPTYLLALRGRLDRATAMYSALRAVAKSSSNSDAGSETNLDKAVHSQFWDWLQSSGNLKHVVNLLHFKESELTDSRNPLDAK